MFINLEKLVNRIKKQKKKSPKISYTAKLFMSGKNFCIKKFMEEAKEFAVSCKYSIKKNITHEAADVLYHFFVLLGLKKISITSIMRELKRRQNISGIQEKINRNKNVR